MSTKGEKKKRNDNKQKNSKTSGSIYLETDSNIQKPVSGIPNK